MINDNRRLLFQQTSLSMITRNTCIYSSCIVRTTYENKNKKWNLLAVPQFFLFFSVRNPILYFIYCRYLVHFDLFFCLCLRNFFLRYKWKYFFLYFSIDLIPRITFFHRNVILSKDVLVLQCTAFNAEIIRVQQTVFPCRILIRTNFACKEFSICHGLTKNSYYPDNLHLC